MSSSFSMSTALAPQSFLPTSGGCLGYGWGLRRPGVAGVSRQPLKIVLETPRWLVDRKSLQQRGFIIQPLGHPGFVA